MADRKLTPPPACSGKSPRTSRENRGWPKEAIRAALPQGVIPRIAARLITSTSHVSAVVARKSRSRRIEGAVAKYLRTKREAIFGPSYPPGPRKKGQGK